MAFDNPTRNRLQRLVSDCRELLTKEFDAQLQEFFGIYAGEGRVLPVERLPHLDDDRLRVAKLLRERVDHLAASQGGTPSAVGEAIRRILREQAFTVLNRFAALRMAEERGLVVEAVGGGFNSKGFKTFSEIAYSGLGDSYSRYRVFLCCLFDEISTDLGVLFDRMSPYGLLFPCEKVLLEFFELLNAPEVKPLWKEDETIGWVYQYFNDPAERKKMREESAAPRNSRELAVRNQFFTPRYVVQFLTDNTLGRIWYEMTKGRTRLKEQCSYLVRRSCEIFMGGLWPNLFPIPPGSWIERVQQGDLSNLPEDPTIDEIRLLAFALDGYVAAEHLGYGEVHEFALGILKAHVQGGAPWPDKLAELWLCMFSVARRQMADSGFLDWVNTEQTLQSLYAAWRKAAGASTGGLSQEDIFRRPVVIPPRPLKDPREIKLLDPACGSMHFGLYAFDLFEVIYEEAWQEGWIPKDEFAPSSFHPFPHDTVVLASVATVHSNYSGSDIPVEDAFFVSTAVPDAGDGIVAHTPYIVSASTKFRVPFQHRISLKEFDYARALREGWFNEDAGVKFVCEVKCFQHAEIESWEALAYKNFRREVPRLIIERNIHGIDIDPRCAQIAGLSLWLRAQKTWQELGLKPADRPRITRSNVVCAEPMPGEKELLREFVEQFAAEERGVFLGLLETIFDKMQLAGEAGSLLKIEEEIRGCVEEARAAWQKLQNCPAELFSIAALNTVSKQRQVAVLETAVSQLTADRQQLTSSFFDHLEERIYSALRNYAEQAENGGGFQRRLFAEDAARGFAFIDICSKRYDVALMNPPFGEPCKGSKNYIASIYPRTKNDVYAAFVERWVGRLNTTGRIGAITSRTGLFLSSFEKWREEILLKEAQPKLLADLGYGVLDSAMVETAAYVLEVSQYDPDLICFRLLADDNKGAAMEVATRTLMANKNDQRVFVVPTPALRQVPGTPFAYWVTPRVRRVFKELPSFEGHGRSVKQGLATADDFRFIRLAWETPPLEHRRTWYPIVRGGSFARFFASISNQVNWQNEGEEIKAWASSLYDNSHWSRIIKSVDFYFRPGLTWPLRGIVFSAQAVPAGCIFSVGGKLATCEDHDSLTTALGLLNSRPFDFFIGFFAGKVGGVQYESGLIGKVPFMEDTSRRIAEFAKRGWTIGRSLDAGELTSHAAVVPSLLAVVGATLCARAGAWNRKKVGQPIM